MATKPLPGSASTRRRSSGALPRLKILNESLPAPLNVSDDGSTDNCGRFTSSAAAGTANSKAKIVSARFIMSPLDQRRHDDEDDDPHHHAEHIVVDASRLGFANLAAAGEDQLGDAVD